MLFIERFGVIVFFHMDEIWYQIDTLTYVKSNLTETLTWLADEQLNSENRRELPVLDSLADFNAKVNIEYATIVLVILT